MLPGEAGLHTEASHTDQLVVNNRPWELPAWRLPQCVKRCGNITLLFQDSERSVNRLKETAGIRLGRALNLATEETIDQRLLAGLPLRPCGAVPRAGG